MRNTDRCVQTTQPPSLSAGPARFAPWAQIDYSTARDLGLRGANDYYDDVRLFKNLAPSTNQHPGGLKDTANASQWARHFLLKMGPCWETLSTGMFEHVD